MDCSPPGSSIHGIFQARILEWDAIAFSFMLKKPINLVLLLCIVIYKKIESIAKRMKMSWFLNGVIDEIYNLVDECHQHQQNS